MPSHNHENEGRISLSNALNQMRNRINPEITLINLRNLNINTPLFECDVAYLHQRIMFTSPNEVSHFLENYCDLHGLYATQMFVNFPLQDTDNEQNITALECALTWNTHPHMIRVLYRWGANVHIPNVNGHFINENTLTPYRNYLRDYVMVHPNPQINLNNYPAVTGLREPNEFGGVMRELDYIVGEQTPPQGWTMPQRFRVNSR